MADEGIAAGAVSRLLHNLTVGTVKAVREHDSRRANVEPREMEQQYQIAVSGKAAAVPAFVEVKVDFKYAFFYASAHRDSSLQYPQFTYGSNTNPAVGIHATVVAWEKDESNGSLVGAVVAIGAVGSGTFTGVVHLTFQGWGVASEVDFVEPEEEEEEGPETEG